MVATRKAGGNMINYENEFEIGYLNSDDKVGKIIYAANPLCIEKDLREKISRMKQDGDQIIVVNRRVGLKWVNYIK
jgi:hypothetical protein